MYNKSENTCLKAKNNDSACMITGKTHVLNLKIRIKYVNDFGGIQKLFWILRVG